MPNYQTLHHLLLYLPSVANVSFRVSKSSPPSHDQVLKQNIARWHPPWHNLHGSPISLMILEFHYPKLQCCILIVSVLSAYDRQLVFRGHTKHIKPSFYYICEKVALRSLETKFVSSQPQLANIFMKPLAILSFYHLHNKLGLVPRPHLRGRDNSAAQSHNIDNCTPP